MRVAVVGSGPAGCAAAIALCRAGADVVLVGDGLDGVGEQLTRRPARCSSGSASRA